MTSLIVAILALIASTASLTLSWISFRRMSSHQEAVDRMRGIEESVVRSVMEEDDTVYAKEIIAAAEKMSMRGMPMSLAVDKAQELYRSRRRP